jgi:hypothetical protein
MPGKGATRSSSTPRERPASASARPSSASGARDAFSRSLNTNTNTGTRDTFSRSLNAGSPSSSRPSTALDLSRTRGDCDADSFSSSGHEKCVCGICTCGRHKCPVQPKTSISYGGDSHFCTTHGDSFVNHDTTHYMPTRSTRGSSVYVPGERFEHTTTHQAHYPWHERPSSSLSTRSTMERATPALLQHTGFGPDVRMDLTTSYGSHFVEHQVPTKSMKPPQASYSYGSPREFLTTKQTDFNGLQPPRCPASVLPSRPCSARSGHVKYTMDFTGTWR